MLAYCRGFANGLFVQQASRRRPILEQRQQSYELHIGLVDQFVAKNLRRTFIAHIEAECLEGF